jgi:lysophospholipase
MIASHATPGVTAGGIHELRRRWEPDGEALAEVVIIHGQGEHSGRYEHVGSILADGGLSVRSYDLIGHGASGGRRGDIEDWTMFLDQLENHVRDAKETGRPTVLFGHSSGPLIGLDYALSERPHPDLMVLSAPALHVEDDIRTRILRPLIPFLGRAVPKLAVRAPVKGEQLSRDPAVGEAFLSDPLVHQPVTMRFAAAYLDAQVRVNANLDKLTIPTLVMHGGMDSIIPARESVELGDLDGVERRLYPTLRHEIFNEPEGPALVNEALEWIKANLPR